MTADKQAMLPNKPSALLRLAVEDSQRIEVTPGYELDMRIWHNSRAGGPCRVCMAGSVMVHRLGVARLRHATPESFDEETRCALVLIDDMRGGDFSGVGLNADLAYRAGVAVTAAYFVRIGRADWSAYLRVADMLEEAGF